MKLRLLATLAIALLGIGLITGCSPEEKSPALKMSKISVDREHMRDAYGRYAYFNGINVSGTTKVPVTSEPDPISYVGRPFPLEDAEKWFKDLHDQGFNSVRLLAIWEAIEHEGRGIYDEEYLQYFEDLVRIAGENDIYVLINFHENMFSRYFHANFTEDPHGRFFPDEEKNTDGGLDLKMLLASLFPYKEGVGEPLKYDARVAGDGAPRWAVEACAPEKNLDSPSWGIFRMLGPLGHNENLNMVIDAFGKLMPPGEDNDTSLIDFLGERLLLMGMEDPPLIPFNLTESSDMMPWTFWGVNVALSADVERCYAAMYAGDKVYPNYKIDGMDLKTYLQDAYAGSWVEIAKRVKKYDNVIGYDMMNEPPGIFIVLSALSAYISGGLDTSAVRTALIELAGENNGTAIYNVLLALGAIPMVPPSVEAEIEAAQQAAVDALDPGASDEEIAAARADARDEVVSVYWDQVKHEWGMDDIDFFATLDLNMSFERTYLQALYQRVGSAILEEDPDAILWLEEGGTIGNLLGDATGGNMTSFLYRPEEFPQVVFTPHWYPDIYPYIGFNMSPRKFVAEEWAERDFTPHIEKKLDKGLSTLGSVPIVFSEFGTYWNYNWDVDDPTTIEADIEKTNYRISSEILDNYYESFEETFTSRMVWCFSADNDYQLGDLWNHEDFSLIGPDGKPRGEMAWMRPVPYYLAGEPKEMHFYSDFHYFDPDKGKPETWRKREFYLSWESKETDAPTEIYVPHVQYPDGFYVWLSDGWATYDSDKQRLYVFSTADDPDWIHEITIRPPVAERPMEDWNYFFSDGRVLVGNGN